MANRGPTHGQISPEVYLLRAEASGWSPERYDEWIAEDGETAGGGLDVLALGREDGRIRTDYQFIG